MTPEQTRLARRRDLYPGGRRRPGANAHNYDPHARNLLDPVRPVTFKRPPPRAIRVACGHWQDRNVWGARKRVHHELRLRRRQLRVQLVPGGAPVRRTALESLKATRTPRGDRRAIQQRALVCIAERAGVESGVVGRWRDGKFLGFLTRHEWAAAVGCTVRQWDRIVSDFKAAGYIKRRQRRDLDQETGAYVGRIASLVVTDKFWHCSGASGARRAYIQEIEDKRRQEYRSRSPRAPSPLEVQPETSAELAAQVIGGESWGALPVGDAFDPVAAAARGRPPPDKR